MSKPLSRESGEKRTRAAMGGVSRLQRRPLTGVWIPVYTDDEYAELEEPPEEFYSLLLNDWTQPDPPLGRHAYRWHMDGSLEMKGYLVPGESATVAYVLHTNWWPSDTASFLTDVTTGSLTFMVGRVLADSTNGEVTITFPADEF